MSQRTASKIRLRYASYFATFFKAWKLALQALRIRAINDRLRQSGEGGETFISRGVQELPPEAQKQLFEKIRAYKGFKNDPYGEHDFGCLEQNGATYYWMINYYDADLSGAGGDPCDAEGTQRILAIMQMRDFVQNQYNTNDLRFLRGFVRM
jgi:hypothetical protein